MIGIIIAAGLGSRMKQFTINNPKCLLKIGKKSLLEWSFENLTNAGCKEVYVITGYKHEKIKELGYQCIDLSEFTNYPELLDGRVKTLHPKIHAGILSKGNNIKHNREMVKFSFQKIDLVIVNFYPFEQIIKRTNNFKKIILIFSRKRYFKNR